MISIIRIILITSVVILTCEANAKERFFLNNKKVPHSLEEFTLLQKQLQEVMEPARKATVSITDGKGFGSGVIVSSDGLVMTAAHVIQGVQQKMTIITEDGTKYGAKSLGLDSDSDAGLLRITEKKEDGSDWDFVEVEMVEKAMSTTKLGDWVFSIGHSGGFDKARGSVVRLGRVVGIRDMPATFQTDCKLIGGDSGGPLFNMHGVLIGIHSRVGMVLDQNNHVTSYDFFTESEDGENKWEKLLRGDFIGEGPFAKKPIAGQGFIGVGLKELKDQLIVTELDKESPAEEAGVMVGDILISIDGEKLQTKVQLKKFMLKKAQGDKVKLTVLREGKEKEFEIILSNR